MDIKNTLNSSPTVEPPRNLGLPDDFELADLLKTNEHGGSSVMYTLGKNLVVKERLNPNSPEHLEVEKRKIVSNLELSKKYLEQFLLKTRVLIKQNQAGVPTIFIIQEKLPAGAVNLNPDGWNFTFNNETRAKLQSLVTQIERMYQETGLMLDLLTLSNIGFSQAKNRFYVYDFDPLICDAEREIELSEQYGVSAIINNPSFKSYNSTQNSDAIEVNLEHLAILRVLSTRTE